MSRNKHPEQTVNRILDVSMKLFIDKGYDKTTIQDIINELGDLSKGAIYHHFKSKEDIFDAATERLSLSSFNSFDFNSLKNKNGLQKIQAITEFNLFSPHQDILFPIMPSLIDQPKLLVKQLSFFVDGGFSDLVTPYLIEGIKDGSIQVSNPEQTAEVMGVLLNIYLNPTIFTCDVETSRKRITYVKDTLELMGIPILTERQVDRLIDLTVQFNESHNLYVSID